MKAHQLFLAALIMLSLLSCQKKKFVKDLERQKWILKSVDLEIKCSGVQTNFTEDNVTGSIEFRDYDTYETTDGTEGLGHVSWPVYPICYTQNGPNTNLEEFDFHYAVFFMGKDEESQLKLWTDPDNKYGTMEAYYIREWDKRKKLVIGKYDELDSYNINRLFTFEPE